VELLVGGRVTRWRLPPELTRGRTLWVLLPCALAGLIPALKKEKEKKENLVAPGNLQMSFLSLQAGRAFGSSKAEG